jgi:predicted  nucleic acid-binding Zn ribbon protein
MFAFEISIENKTGCKQNDLADKFTNVLVMLNRNGQIRDEWTAFLDKTFVRANVELHEKTSCAKKFCSEYFFRDNAELEQLSGAKLQYRFLGRIFESGSACCCQSHDFFVLQTSFLQSCSPILCGACGGAVPLYRIPHLPDEKEHWSIQNWVWQYQACDDLNAACDFGEKWGTRQMTEPASGLSKRGREICAEIEEVSGTPTYYYLYNYRYIKTEQDRLRPCPVCGGNWFQGEEKRWFEQFRCDSCRLVSNLTFNSR